MDFNELKGLGPPLLVLKADKHRSKNKAWYRERLLPNFYGFLVVLGSILGGKKWLWEVIFESLFWVSKIGSKKKIRSRQNELGVVGLGSLKDHYCKGLGFLMINMAVFAQVKRAIAYLWIARLTCAAKTAMLIIENIRVCYVKTKYRAIF